MVNQAQKDGATIPSHEESRKSGLLEAESRIVDARAWGWGAKERWRDICQRVENVTQIVTSGRALVKSQLQLKLFESRHQVGLPPHPKMVNTWDDVLISLIESLHSKYIRWHIIYHNYFQFLFLKDKLIKIVLKRLITYGRG